MKYKRWFLLCTGELVLEEDAWKFPGSHILGDLRRMTMEGASVTSLALWLTPADCEHVPPFNPEIVAYLIGDARLIRCRFDGCGNQQRWEGSLIFPDRTHPGVF